MLLIFITACTAVVITHASCIAAGVG